MEKPAILILDSDTLMRHRLLDALAPLKQPVLSAGTLEEGKIMLNNNRIDVLLLDCPLEGESMEILTEITAGFPFTRIIALIDMTAVDVAVEADKRGVFSCLAKPFEQSQLLFLMEWAMKDRGNRHRRDMEKESFRKLFDAAPDSIVILDSKGKIVMANSHFEELFGYRRSAVIGAQIDMLVPGRFPRHPNHVHDFMKYPRKRPMRNVTELAAVRADGSEFPADISLSPYTTDQGLMVFTIIRDISERVQYQQQLNYQANHDELTSLPNRRLLLDRIEQAIIYSTRYNSSAALLYIDLDRFKVINSSLGHNEGDKLLKIMAERLSSHGRACDTVARQGGDDFVLVVRDLTAEYNVAKIAAKVLDTVSQPIELDSQELQVTCSIGISIYPKDGTNSETLLKNADAAMFRAKEHGRNNYQFFTPQLSAIAAERLTMEKCLRRALGNEEFRIVYQPQVDLTTGHMTGVEALLRWDNAELGAVSPGTFIPLAEETGLIVAIGEWVLENACRQSSRWQKAGLPPLTMAVNLSTRQLWVPGLTDFIDRTLVECGLDPSFLELEITETMMMRDQQHVVSILRKIKNTGAKLAIDDFGTGYSSLSQLRNYPFDKLKLDISFVREIISDPGSAAIARTIISLGHNLGLKVTAEGVETEAQLSYLWSHGCDEMQGYYFSRPLPAEEMEQLLRQGSCLGLPRDQPADMKTILVVDDESQILTSMSRLFRMRKDNLRVLTAANADEGFEQLALNKVDIVLSDMVMPGMNGLEFLGRVKGLYPDVTRLAMSGHADVDMVAESINQNAISKFLLKPVDMDRLSRVIDEACFPTGKGDE